ncbi:hypothetical protein OE88DRAFT_1552791 [Heliocybe sulcata]|uniref:Transcription regulator Rua1 C-terminal domain-containing protein n=1 Tax=Heliocybe sulcata TaxID=5364 RepID=A0A5C3N4V6_9AGAM|nr:hypothetical protein OE88DRAFT_1552791 [Heliocybe sulcata]
MLRLSPYPCHEDASLPNSPQRSKSSPTSLRSPFVSRNGQRAKPPPLLWTHSPRLTYQELWARTDSPTAPASICDTPLGLYNFKYCTPSRTPSLSSIAAAPSFPSPCKKLEEDDLFATPAAPLHMPGESDESPVLRRTESVGSLPQSQPISSSLNFRSHSISAQSDGSEYLELCYLGSTVPALIYSRSGSQSDTFSTPLSSPSVGFATSTSPLTPLTPLTPEHYGRSPGGYMRSSPSSSLGSLSSQSSPLLQPARSKLQKRKRQDPESPTPRTRVKSGSALILPGYGSPEIQSAKDENPQAFRTFPPHMPVHAAFPGFYTRFRVSSYHQQNTQLIAQMEREGTYQPPGSPLDLYTPRFVKGIGRTKMGLCPICIEGEGEGKPGEKRWLYMKTSAYKW